MVMVLVMEFDANSPFIYKSRIIQDPEVQTRKLEEIIHTQKQKPQHIIQLLVVVVQN